MTDILNRTYGVIQCKECPWYKSLRDAMRFTAEDLRRQLESQMRELIPPCPTTPDYRTCLSSMATSAQNLTTGRLPHFRERLRTVRNWPPPSRN